MEINHWKEPYPESLDELVMESETIAKHVSAELVKAPRIRDLYDQESGKACRVNNFFDKIGHLPKTVKNDNDLSCVYVFGEEISGKVKPIYVGITRTFVNRLRNHGWGLGHSQATLAFLMAKNHHDELHLRQDFPEELIEPFREKVRSLRVAVWPVENPYDLHFHEVAVAGILKTKWNTFKTH